MIPSGEERDKDTFLNTRIQIEFKYSLFTNIIFTMCVRVHDSASVHSQKLNKAYWWNGAHTNT